MCEYLLYNEKFQNAKDVPDMDIPPELCLELLMAADYLNGEWLDGRRRVGGGVPQGSWDPVWISDIQLDGLADLHICCGCPVLSSAVTFVAVRHSMPVLCFPHGC